MLDVFHVAIAVHHRVAEVVDAGLVPWKCYLRTYLRTYLCGHVICVYVLACCLHSWMPLHGNRCYSIYMRTADMCCSTDLYHKSSKGSSKFLDVSRKKREMGFS